MQEAQHAVSHAQQAARDEALTVIGIGQVQAEARSEPNQVANRARNELEEVKRQAANELR